MLCQTTRGHAKSGKNQMLVLYRQVESESFDVISPPGSDWYHDRKILMNCQAGLGLIRSAPLSMDLRECYTRSAPRNRGDLLP